jgi:hypothetical protein
MYTFYYRALMKLHVQTSSFLSYSPSGSNCFPRSSYPNNEDLQVWKGVVNNSDLDDSMLLLRNVRIDAEGKLDEASLRMAAQLPISHEKLDTIEDELGGLPLIRQAPNLFTSSREILCSCAECSRLLSRDYIVAQRTLTEQSTATSQSSND